MIVAVCDVTRYGGLQRRYHRHKFVSVIRQIALTGALAFLIVFLISACTSGTNDTLSGPSSAQSAGAVPGEKMSDEERYAPGPMGSSNVRW